MHFFHLENLFSLSSYLIYFRETFGESLIWAGCTLIMLLGQQHRFEALDFCSHILRVQEVDARQEIVAGVVRKIILIPRSFCLFQIDDRRASIIFSTA